MPIQPHLGPKQPCGTVLALTGAKTVPFSKEANWLCKHKMNLFELHMTKTAITLGPKQSYGVPKWPQCSILAPVWSQNGPTAKKPKRPLSRFSTRRNCSREHKIQLRDWLTKKRTFSLTNHVGEFCVRTNKFA